VRYLLDTNVIVFMVCAPRELSRRACDLLQYGDGLCLSIASLWEIAIKCSIGKLNIALSASGIADECAKRGIDVIPISPAALDAIGRLPAIHGDPFDRLLVAQAQTAGLTIITRDGTIPKYDVQTIW